MVCLDRIDMEIDTSLYRGLVHKRRMFHIK